MYRSEYWSAALAPSPRFAPRRWSDIAMMAAAAVIILAMMSAVLYVGTWPSLDEANQNFAQIP